MALYGLFTFTHHGGIKVLTVMSDEGAKTALERMTPTPGITTKPRPGYLTQYRPEYKGAMEHFIETNGIVVLKKPQWDEKKVELGERVL